MFSMAFMYILHVNLKSFDKGNFRFFFMDVWTSIWTSFSSISFKNTYLTYNYPYSYLLHQDEDLDRTVGINTCYVGTSDFELEEADKDYVISVSWFLYHPCVIIGCLVLFSR